MFVILYRIFVYIKYAFGSSSFNFENFSDQHITFVLFYNCRMQTIKMTIGILTDRRQVTICTKKNVRRKVTKWRENRYVPHYLISISEIRVADCMYRIIIGICKPFHPNIMDVPMPVMTVYFQKLVGAIT